MPLESKPVPCACPDAFIATVLDTLPGPIRMLACLRCGQTELADPVIAEPHPHDVQLLGFDILPMTPPAREWASAWPRFIEQIRPRVYLGAEARFDTTAVLTAAIEAARTQQQSMGLRDILVSLGIPPSEPPESLPDQLRGFREIWHGLQLNDATPVEELLDAATRWNGPNQLAADVLVRRNDLEQWGAAMIGNFDDGRRQWGRYLVKQFRLSGPQAMAAIRSRLSEIPDNSTGEISEIGRMLHSLGPAAIAARTEVESAAERVKDDYYAHKELLDMLNRWSRS
jgi:hypothetical protein